MTTEKAAEDVCMEHYVALVPYKPKCWVTCHQPRDMEDAMLLTEAYMSAEAGEYLKKNLQKQAARANQVHATVPHGLYLVSHH